MEDPYYNRINDIVRNYFPKILVPIFKTEWEKLTSLTWFDDAQSASEFWPRETNWVGNARMDGTISTGDSSTFDSSTLFALILNSRSVGGKFKKHYPHQYSAVGKLRQIRNKIIHRRPNTPMGNREFKRLIARIRKCFAKLGFVTSPEVIRKASCQYPQRWNTIMRELTELIYTMNWTEVDKKGKECIAQSPDWSVKLFVKIELAYSHCVRGDGKKATDLLQGVVRNVTKAGSYYIRILSRAFSRQALCHIFEQDIAQAQGLAKQALNLIATLDSPEEEILARKRLADVILNGEGTVDERRKKLEPLYNRIIELSQKHKDDIPRCRQYLRFAYQDLARLCLGFTKDGFIDTTREELDEGERHLKTIEENEDPNDTNKNTYPNAFIFVCKSIARYKRWNLQEDEQQKEVLWREASEAGERARNIASNLQKEANTSNSGLKLMIQLLDRYRDQVTTMDFIENR